MRLPRVGNLPDTREWGFNSARVCLHYAAPGEAALLSSAGACVVPRTLIYATPSDIKCLNLVILTSDEKFGEVYRCQLWLRNFSKKPEWIQRKRAGEPRTSCSGVRVFSPKVCPKRFLQHLSTSRTIISGAVVGITTNPLEPQIKFSNLIC